MTYRTFGLALVELLEATKCSQSQITRLQEGSITAAERVISPMMQRNMKLRSNKDKVISKVFLTSLFNYPII